MTDEVRLVDEGELIEELIHRTPEDEARLRVLCGVLFGNEEVAERQHMPRTAAILRSAYMASSRFGDGRAVGRLYEFRDDLTEISATIYGGPPRKLSLVEASA